MATEKGKDKTKEAEEALKNLNTGVDPAQIKNLIAKGQTKGIIQSEWENLMSLYGR